MGKSTVLLGSMGKIFLIVGSGVEGKGLSCG
jgi:hypothetical protein